MNIVLNESNEVMSPVELAAAANDITKRRPFRPWNYDQNNPECRIAGNGHCDCGGNGIFKLLPKDHPDVVEGGKRYMQCTICGGWSHL